MSRLKSYLNRLTLGKGKKDGKKSPPKASVSMEPPALTFSNDSLSILRNSISLDSATNSTSNNIMEEILSQNISESPPPPVCDGVDRLTVAFPAEEEDEANSIILETTVEYGHDALDNLENTKGTNDLSKISSISMQSPASDAPHYLPMSFIRTPDRGSNCSTPSINLFQPPLSIPPPASKPRQFCDGYIPLDTCSSGKRIASFKLEEERRHTPLCETEVTSDCADAPRRPIVRIKDLYFLESVPPIPNHIFYDKLPPPPLPTKISYNITSNNRRQASNSVVPHLSRVPTNSWNSNHLIFDRKESRYRHPNSFHSFSDQCHVTKSSDKDLFGGYVECDKNNNNDFTQTDFRLRERYEEKRYYNETGSSLPRNRLLSHMSQKFDGVDNDCKHLLRIPVPLPKRGVTRFHSYANESRNNSFKKKIFEKAITYDESTSSHYSSDVESGEDYHLHPRRFLKTNVSNTPRKHFTTYGGDADSLDESSSFSHEDASSISETLPLEEANMPYASQIRAHQEIKAFSRNLWDSKQRTNMEINYLQLDLENGDAFVPAKNEPEHVSDYRKIDWLKTKALSETMNDRIKIKGTGAAIVST